MKAKKGYKQQKTDWTTGKWLKRYFEKRTCRRLTKRMKENMKDLPLEYSKTVNEIFRDLVDKEE